MEIVAKSAAEALNKVVETHKIAPEHLEVIEEYEPDDLDLQQYKEENGLTAEPNPTDVTLYVVRIGFDHYIKEAQEWTQGLIERFAPGSTAEAIRFRNLIIVRLNVPETSILIGKQGATLDALQHIVVRALLTIDEKFPDVMLDVERYREKKLQRLEKEATRSADKAVRIGRRIPLPPMSPAERKFIHNLLKDMPGIKTESRGEDRERHIVLEPLNPSPQRGRPSGGGGFGNRGGSGGGGGRGNFNKGGAGAGAGGGGNFNKRGPGPGGPQGRGGNPNANPGNQIGGRGNQKPPITEEQRRLLYGNGNKKDPADYEDPELEGKRSILPEYLGGNSLPDEEDDSQKRFLGEFDDEIR